MDGLIKYQTDHGEVQLSKQIIKQYLVPNGSNVTDQEVGMFLELCKFQKLNPFLREVYLVKYGTAPASMVTGKEVFTKRAMKNEKFAGFEAGITIAKEDGKIERREGSMLMMGERLLGGWARVHLKDFTVPLFEEVSMQEYIGKKSDGTPTGMWATKPSTMIRKVALVHAMREAFPEAFEGLYSQEEINHIDTTKLPTAPVEIPAYQNATVVEAKIVSDAEYIEPEYYPEEPIVPVLPAHHVIAFGKHAGRTLGEIAEIDYKYLEWLKDKANDSGTKEVVTKFLRSSNVTQHQPSVVQSQVTPSKTASVKSAPVINDYTFPADDDAPLPWME